MPQLTETLSPEQFADEIAFVLPRSVPAERTRLLDHARAWATVYYTGDVPQALTDRLRRLEIGCRYLTT